MKDNYGNNFENNDNKHIYNNGGLSYFLTLPHVFVQCMQDFDEDLFLEIRGLAIMEQISRTYVKF